MLRHAGLLENRRVHGIDAGREIDSKGKENVFPQFFRILRNGDGVIVDNKHEIVKIFLERNDLIDHSEVVSEMEKTTWLQGGKKAVHTEERRKFLEAALSFNQKREKRDAFNNGFRR